MLTHVEFRSGNFAPHEGEQQLINPDLWGKRLVDFLRAALKSHGYQLRDPIPEDWGWELEILNQPFRLSIGCGHYQEHEDSYLCFIEPHKPVVWKLLRRIDTRERVGKLQQILDKILSEEPSIYAKRWWTYDGFNQPGSEKPPSEA